MSQLKSLSPTYVFSFIWHIGATKASSVVVGRDSFTWCLWVSAAFNFLSGVDSLGVTETSGRRSVSSGASALHQPPRWWAGGWVRGGGVRPLGRWPVIMLLCKQQRLTLRFRVLRHRFVFVLGETGSSCCFIYSEGWLQLFISSH